MDLAQRIQALEVAVFGASALDPNPVHGIFANAADHPVGPMQIASVSNTISTAKHGDAVRLPKATAGMTITIANDGPATLHVYPFGKDSINGMVASVTSPLVLNPALSATSVSHDERGFTTSTLGPEFGGVNPRVYPGQLTRPIAIEYDPVTGQIVDPPDAAYFSQPAGMVVDYACTEDCAWTTKDVTPIKPVAAPPVATPVVALPLPIIAGPSSIAAGAGSILLTATPGDSFRWSNGATSRTITVTSPGTFTVTTTTDGVSATSNAFTVTAG